MANNKIIPTIFQNLDRTFSGNWDMAKPNSNSYDIKSDNDILYKTDNKEKYEKTKLELQQNNYLANRWQKANVDLSLQAFNGLNNVKLMYRDVDLMDSFPEIGAALDIVSEEAAQLSDKGQIINVYSQSERIKSVLEDLFINRLDLHATAQMVIRGMCKYGNQFMLLNIDNKLGITGWRQLPVFNMERVEHGIENPYSSKGALAQGDKTDMQTKFIWMDEANQAVPFRNWQIGHFRLINNSMYLPYGVSYLNNARRHWRLLSLMEDMMMIYRLERSMERRVYKIFVGAIDDADIPAYVQEVANNFKRTPIIDPLTGQLDLRKNILSIDNDVFIPTRDANAPTPIDTLPAAQNLTAIDDIKFIQKKVLASLRIPRAFLNFDESTGEGKNLALLDIRFARTINRIQQAFLMELTKIATIHLYILGFEDELTNFSLSMNNPSTQAEGLEIENIQKKIQAIRDAVADPGGGIPIMSLQRALRQIMKFSDKDIQENLEEIRLERALASELEKTSQIIQRTKIFDSVDRMYGEPNAEYQDGQEQGQGMDGGMPMGGGGGMPMGDIGGDIPTEGEGELGGLGELGSEEGGDIQGSQGEVPMTDNGESEAPMESVSKNKPLLTETITKFVKRNKQVQRPKILNESLIINDEFDKMLKSLDNITE